MIGLAPYPLLISYQIKTVHTLFTKIMKILPVIALSAPISMKSSYIMKYLQLFLRWSQQSTTQNFLVKLIDWCRYRWKWLASWICGSRCKGSRWILRYFLWDFFRYFLSLWFFDWIFHLNFSRIYYFRSKHRLMALRSTCCSDINPYIQKYIHPVLSTGLSPEHLSPFWLKFIIYSSIFNAKGSLLGPSLLISSL